MGILDELVVGLPEGEIVEVVIGLHWTAVVADVDGRRQCGLASTLAAPHEHSCGLDIPHAGTLEQFSGLEMAAFAQSSNPTLASVGVAAINALMPPVPDAWVDRNAGDVIADRGAGKTVALIGHFPFIPQVRERVGKLHVQELRPRPGDLHADAASEIVPHADLVAITGMSLINHTFDELLELCSPEALILVLGPSTPLSPLMFERGVDMLSGSYVTEIQAVLKAVQQGAHFRQVRKQGVRLITMDRPGLTVE